MPEHTKTENPLTVAVTGATGFVGTSVVRELLRCGHAVHALIRDVETARRRLPLTEISSTLGDIFDTGALAELTRDCDAFIHLVGVRRESGRQVTYKRMHIDATSAALNACAAAGVNRFVHMSALGARPDAPSAYHRTKFEAETLVRRSELAWTIFRPSLIIGAGGEFMEMAMSWARGAAPPYVFLPYFFRHEPLPGEPTLSGLIQPVDVGDVAGALVRALDAPDAVGEVYELGGPESMTWPQLLIALRDATPGANTKLKPHGVPGLYAHYGATIAQRLGLGSALPFGPSEPLMAMEDSTCPIDKPRAQLGFDPAPLRESLAAAAQ